MTKNDDENGEDDDDIGNFKEGNQDGITSHFKKLPSRSVDQKNKN